MHTEKIRVFLINGFLGSGKTTFLLKLLALFSSRKCGVLMNEFGEIGIDGLLLPKKELELIEINGGSIFCQCRHNNFIEALIQFSTTPIKILFIEASGLADPVTMDRDLQIVKEKVGEIFNFSGSICLIDSLHFLDLINVLQIIEKQILYASLCIINKIDLVTPERILGIESKLFSINPKIKLMKTSFGELSPDQVDDLYHPINARAKKEIPSICVTAINARDITIRANDRLNSYKVRKYFSELAKHTRRMKGFIQLDDGQWYYLDSVNGSLSLTQTDSLYRQTEIVVIFKEGIEEELINKAERLWELLLT